MSAAAGLRLTLELCYEQPARRANYLLRLAPRSSLAPVEIEAAPFSNARRAFRDAHGNATTFVSMDAPHDRATFACTWRGPIVPATPPPEADWQAVRAELREPRSSEALDAAIFAARVSADEAPEPAIAAFGPGASLAEALDRLQAAIAGGDRAFARALAAIRASGLAVRAMSGIAILPDRTAEHRFWLAVYAGAGSWCDFEPFARPALLGRIVLAWGRKMDEVAPLRAVAVDSGDFTHRLSCEASFGGVSAVA